MYGVRRMISTTSSQVKRMPASCAIAGRCRPALVEPPVAPTTTAAFSSALAGDDVARAEVAADQLHHRLAGLGGPAVAVLVGRGGAGGAGQRQADRLGDASPWCWR